MTRTKIAEFNLKRPKSSHEVTQNFHKQLQLLDSFGYGLSGNAVIELLNISKRTLLRWEEEQLVFPLKVKTTEGYVKKKYRYKDVLRCITIKFLKYDYKLKRFKAIRLFLEMANLAIYTAMESPKSINNIRIDKFLMRTLNYDIDEIAAREYGRSSKRKDIEIIDTGLDEDLLELGEENDSIE